MKRIAVVGGGIAGIAAADRLSRWADVTIFEAAPRLGGHTDTHEFELGGRRVAVDSGFIVFNRRNYPLFAAWLDELGVASQPTDMSFSVHRMKDGFEYGTEGLRAMLVQPRNLLNVRFFELWRDLLRFYRDAPTAPPRQGETVAQYCARLRLGDVFLDDHLLPICAALWSQPHTAMRDADMGLVRAFMENHGMLTLDSRPQWRVIVGGSQRYVEAFRSRFRGYVRCATPVDSVRAGVRGITIRSRAGIDRFDAVVMACHSDQALALLESPSGSQRDVLSAMRYQPNHVFVHTDPGQMPEHRAAWSSWNFRVDERVAGCRVTYWMNRLQHLDSPQPIFVTLNAAGAVREESILAERRYAHPVFDTAAVAAQARLPAIQGEHHVYFAGAYARWGFHEDGFASGRDAAARLAQHEGASHAA